MVDDLASIALALLDTRAPEATVCPSEVARAVAKAARAGPGAGDWRGVMPSVHAAVDRLVAEGRVQLSWKGRKLAARVGPYRIGRVQPAGAPEDEWRELPAVSSRRALRPLTFWSSPGPARNRACAYCPR